MGMSEFYGAQTPEADALKLMSRAYALGITLFDTADCYGPHHNEQLLGKWIAQQRPTQLQIASKFGIVREPGQYERTLDNRPAYIKSACEASLQRLGVEHIDLYYVHRVNPEHPIEETMDTLAGLVREGKIGHIGLCEVNAETLRRAHAVHPVTALQTEYSLWTRDVEDEILPTCRELGIGFVPYSPLGRGFLAGRIQKREDFEPGDFRAMLPRFSEANFNANQALADYLAQFAAHKQCSPAQLSLAWLLAQGDDIVPIPGTKHLHYLEDNAGAPQVKLTAEDLKTINEATQTFIIAGERYTEEGMKGVNV
ncbi:aldo/keto reductase [Terasakiispira papahanaumokuakeensis]|uniref:Aldo/keto reductase n=2 Tax=Terasakiispira papahanaumokuakeensis TaxID=197479 RepID=A0A1E2VEL9_9GAMM|nr:aldo/keto reductase [Terasakiispira papahanaumokuakeensis]